MWKSLETYRLPEVTKIKLENWKLQKKEDEKRKKVKPKKTKMKDENNENSLLIKNPSRIKFDFYG